MKKIITAFYILIPILFLLSGCSNDMNRREIDEINFIHVMGIDYAPGEYTISALYSSGMGADPEKGGSAGKEELIKGTGSTPYGAFEDLKLRSKKSISVANTGYFLLGDSAALNGIRPCLDFISHDETIKMEALIFVTKGERASDFLKRGIENEQTIQVDLEAVKQKQRDLVKRNDNSVVNILNEMEQSYYSILIPYFTADEKSFLIGGYAVFDNLKLKDYLDMDTSSGVNFIRDIIKVYPIYLKDEAALTLTYSDTRLKSELENGRIKVIIRVDFETMVKEVLAGRHIYNEQELSKLTKDQNAYVTGILEKAVNYSVMTGLDILKISQLIENEHVKEWAGLKESFEEHISDIRYEYIVQSKITKSFIMESGK